MEIKPDHPKGNQSWIFIGRTDAEADAPILWPPDVKNWLIREDPDAGKDWRQEEKGTTDNEMVGWYHRLDGHEFEQAPGVGDGQGNLACCSPRGHKEPDTTEGLNWPEVCLTRKVMWSDLHLRLTDPLEEGIEAHSNILAWRIPRDRGAYLLQSIGSHRVGHDWSDLACMHTELCKATSSEAATVTLG